MPAPIVNGPHQIKKSGTVLSNSNDITIHHDKTNIGHRRTATGRYFILRLCSHPSFVRETVASGTGQKGVWRQVGKTVCARPAKEKALTAAAVMAALFII
jgi:hypothetical protein